MIANVFSKLKPTRRQFIWVRAKSKKQESSKKYSYTLNLPNTDFPLSLRDGEANRREVKIQKSSGFDKLYEWQQNQPGDKEFILHDGPPYANGKPHVGHAINKILKDITNRYRLMRGYRIHYKPGWDCHGLPIEMKAVSSKAKLTPLQIRDKAKKFAREAITVQMEAFKRWGVMADWDKQCYYTFDPQYEAKQMEVFYQMYEKGLIYQDFMPVYWSPSSGTALAESELEYNPDHKSKSVYVTFPVTKSSEQLENVIGWAGRDVYAVIWTTTPWTLPGNKAICIGPELRYICAEDPDNSNIYICEQSFVDKLSELLEKSLRTLNDFSGSAFEGAKYTHPLTGEELPFLFGKHVTVEKGAGLVHTAPGHGHDDFVIAINNGLKVTSIVDEKGQFDWHAGKELEGRTIGVDAEEKVIELLGNHIIKVEDYVHKYPYDWRTKKPVIIRASKQWFVSTNKLKNKALECLNEVSVHPKSSENSMQSMLGSRPYWCISRQRVWGLPIPVFYHKQTKQPLVNRATIDHLKSLVIEHGSDCWWKLSEEELLPTNILTKMGLGKASDYVKGEDILDIWFDSGISWAAVLSGEQKADLYLEGLDQFGGWFQSSLLTSVALTGSAPYKSLLVHGFAVDEEGKKMSKSVGNVIDPEKVINGGKNKSKEPSYGADVLRLWSAECNLQSNVMIGPTILEKCNEEIYKIRKVLRYLLGNVNNFDNLSLSMHQLWPQDRYMLHLLHQFGTQVSEHYDDYRYGKVMQTVEKFINIEVSNFYCSIIKDRLYCSDKESLRRQSSQFVQYHIINVVTRALAPILPHFAEELYQYYQNLEQHKDDSIFKGGWFDLDPNWYNKSSANLIKPVLDIKDHLNSVIVSENPVEFDVIIYASNLLYEVLTNFQMEETSCSSPLTEIMQTSYTVITKKPLPIIPEDVSAEDGVCNVYVQEDIKQPEQYMLIISAATQNMCERCRRYTSESAKTPCERCLNVMAGDWK
ncbi:isoleucine--tRNA ligase, mitochondrial-like isoform X1 [Mytilus edulis]|uniref:isoleucine--tRNA ligase, mitochondrial-like isoform X1 n=2 Tax=Mytilus edulis TaxID=6550 RepID=UPI0039EECE5D